MSLNANFRSITAITTICAALLILAATVVLSMAVDFNTDFLSDPAGLISNGLRPNAPGLFRWGSILELFGYFLFLIPLTVFLWQWLKHHYYNLVSIATICNLGSILLGIAGAAVRAIIWPEMISSYPQMGEAQQEVLQVLFRAVTSFTFEGLYAVESILFGIWMLGIGLALQVERRFLGIVTWIIGIAAFGAGIGWILGVDPLARLEMAYFLEPFWLIWLGIVILRRAERGE